MSFRSSGVSLVIKRNKAMTDKQKSRLVEVINLNIEEANRLFKTKEQSDAYIIGFLQGVLRVVRDELEEGIEEKVIS